jgi:outer membrane protein insertion porin family
MRACVLAVLVACGGGSSRAAPPSKPTGTPVAPRPSFSGKWTELSGPVKKIRVTGADTMRAQVEIDLAAAIGKPIDADMLRGALQGILKSSGVADVTIQGAQLAGGIELVVDITLHPILRSLSAIEVGGKAISLGMTSVSTSSPLDPIKVQALATSLRERYVGTGHFNADATWRSVPVANGVDVVIEVAPGPAATIESIGFQGNTVATKQLAAQLTTILVVGQPALEKKLEAAGDAVARYYWDIGFASVKVTAPKPVAGKNALVFRVVEGPKFKIGPVKITGDLPTTDHAKYLALFGVKQGDTFSRTKIDEGRDRMLTAIDAIGKANATVTPLTKVDNPKATISLTLEVALGP